MRIPNRRELIKQLKSVGLYAEIGDDWINIRDKSGTNCEFYGSGEHVCGTYTVDGRERELDFWLPQDTEEFVTTVYKILKF